MATKTLTFDIFGRDRNASKTIRGIGIATDSLRRGALKLGAAIGVAFSARAIIDFGRESVNAFLEAGKAQAKLEDAYSRFPALADTNISALQKLNKQLMLKTGVDDDAIATGQATLAQYNLTGEQIKKLTPLLVDYARKQGKDIPDAASDLGKALLGQGRSLKDVGIDFVDAGSVAANFDQIVTGLTDKVGGFADAYARTDAGKFELLAAKWGEFQEKVGEALLPGLSALADFANSEVMPGLQDWAEWFGTDGVNGIKVAFDWVVKYKDILGPAAIALGTLTAAQWLLNIAMDANPIGLVILALAGLVTAGTIVATNWEQFSASMIMSAQLIKSAFVSSINAVIDVLNAVVAPLNSVIGAINWLTGTNFPAVRIPKIEQTLYIPDFGYEAPSEKPGGRVGGRYQFAAGAMVRAVPGGIDATIGEGRYDEIVLPMSGNVLQDLADRISDSGAGGNVTNNFNVTNPDPAVVVAAIEQRIGRKLATRGR